MVFGKEVGESGTPHLQGYVLFTRYYSADSVKKLHGRCHWEHAKTGDAMNYCMKDQNYFKKIFVHKGSVRI